MELQRVAIVDRGPSALRLVHAVIDMGGRPVAVHIHDDRAAPWVRAAADALDVGDAPSLGAAIDDHHVIRAVAGASCSAVWAGWSLGSSAATLSAQCRALGVAWIGPDDELLARLSTPEASAHLATVAGIGIAPAQRSSGARRVAVDVACDHGGTVQPLAVRTHDGAVDAAPSGLVPARVFDAARCVCHAAGMTGIGHVELELDSEGTPSLVALVPGGVATQSATELVTGRDLAALELRLAAGEAIEAVAPTAVGHAVTVRLAVIGTPGADIVTFRPPVGTGIQVDVGASTGGRVQGVDPTVATISAWGSTPTQARSRLRRALLDTDIIVDPGDTNRADLVAALENDGRGRPVDPAVPLLWAAVEAYEIEHTARRARFREAAARGRPEVDATIGHTCELSLGTQSWQFGVHRTGPASYRVTSGDSVADVAVERFGATDGRLRWDGRTERVVSVVRGSTHVVQVGGVTHRIARDDGGAVRAPMPAVAVFVAVAPGDVVAPGDPLVVLEAMKMETVVRADAPGRVRSVRVIANTHVAAGTTLLQVDPIDGGTEHGVAEGLDLSIGAGPRVGATCHEVFATIRSYALGYDVDPADRQAIVGRQDALVHACAADAEALAAHERELLELFADLCALTAARPHPEDEGRSPAEHLLAFLRFPRTASAALPVPFMHRLRRVLERYGAATSESAEAFEDALFRLFRAQRRLADLVPAVVAILDRRLERASVGTSTPTEDERALLGELVVVAEGRYQTVSDLARELRYVAFERPALLATRAEADADAEAHLAALAADPDALVRAHHLAALVANTQPLRPTLLAWYRRSEAPAVRSAAVEAALRRYYRIRQLEDVRVEPGPIPLAVAEYDHEVGRVHVLALYGGADQTGALLERVEQHVAGVADRRIVIDAHLWSDRPLGPIDDLVVAIRARLDALSFGSRLYRVNLTLTAPDGATSHVCFRHGDDDGFYEDVFYRNLHPMLAKRLEVSAFANFAIDRLPTAAEDVYLFHAVGHDNPEDERLLAVAEVRDNPTVRDEGGRVVALPMLERIAFEALSAIRHAQSHRPPERRLLDNRLTLFVRPTWDVPEADWLPLANRLAPATRGLGLEKVVLRVQIPDPDTGALVDAVLDLHNPGGRGVVVERRNGGVRRLQPRSRYRQRVLQVQRRGGVYPYELIRQLTPAPVAASVFPTGFFVEHDLDESGALAPVDRPSGENAANIVVGVITNLTETQPDGMTRVAILGDPSRGLGNLAEPECRRIIAALDLAEQLHVPVEWYAVSSGALIAMDSGTENMDWISAVLRRIIEFTQAGGEINVVVTGINVGAQPYWNAEATMLMHTKGILVMTPESAMVLTGKGALDFSGGVSADDNFGIGGYERVMGPNGQGQYWAPDVTAAALLLLRHYEHTYVVPGERFPRRSITSDPVDRDVCASPHASVPGSDFRTVGDVFSVERNPERKKPFDIRSVLRAVADADREPLERWGRMGDADTGVVWDAHIGGIPVLLLGIESHNLLRDGQPPADGPTIWSSGTLYPRSSKKLARAINAASGNRPLVVLANLSGFDGSPESMRSLQLEYGAEIGRAVVNFDGPIVFVVVSRYHGGAFVVFSKRLNEHMEIAAVEGSFASVIGGAPAAAVVFSRDVDKRTAADPRVRDLDAEIAETTGLEQQRLRARRAQLWDVVRSEKLGEVADEFAQVHTIQRAERVGSVDRIVPASQLRPYVVDALERGLARYKATGGIPASPLTTVSTNSP